MNILSSDHKDFYLNGAPFQLISGAIHYFRVPRAYWRDRLEKLLALGCNTVETYVPWNLHEPRPGEFCFDNMLDIEGFIALADEMGLLVIVRPSPYICGEFEFGGQPWWLLQDPAMRVRSSEGPYLDAVARYYHELLPRLRPFLGTCGGPIIACQVENEYGYYGNDKAYLRALKAMFDVHGINVLLFTTDGPWGEALEAGSLEGLGIGGSFGSGAPEHFRKIASLNAGFPLFCSEFWMGWFDAWGDEHHVRSPESAAESLDEILALGHVNLYMFHGGTNFGFTAGANHYEVLKPDVTSYDYDAPLSESGDLTPKYHAFREVIARHHRNPSVAKMLREAPAPFSSSIVKKAFGTVLINEKVSLGSVLGSLARPRIGPRPYGMEELGQGYGYVLYRCHLTGPRTIDRMLLWKCNDRALVYVNGVKVFHQEDNDLGSSFTIDLPKQENQVDILVENQGRVNFGEKMNDQRKGIYGAIIIDKHGHSPVESWGLPLDCFDDIDWKSSYIPGGPGLYRSRFDLELRAGTWHDSFLRLDGWGKGFVWLNGHNLGRFWNKGPQRTLYVPGPFLRERSNELVIFETEGQVSASVQFVDQADLG